MDRRALRRSIVRPSPLWRLAHAVEPLDCSLSRSDSVGTARSPRIASTSRPRGRAFAHPTESCAACSPGNSAARTAVPRWRNNSNTRGPECSGAARGGRRVALSPSGRRPPTFWPRRRPLQRRGARGRRVASLLSGPTAPYPFCICGRARPYISQSRSHRPQDGLACSPRNSAPGAAVKNVRPIRSRSAVGRRTG
jgi:hypothetical protein